MRTDRVRTGIPAGAELPAAHLRRRRSLGRAGQVIVWLLAGLAAAVACALPAVVLAPAAAAMTAVRRAGDRPGPGPQVAAAPEDRRGPRAAGRAGRGGRGRPGVRRSLAVVAARAARAARGLWPDRNPLRRRLDRAEAAIAAGLAMAFLAAAPWAAMTAWHRAYQAASGTVNAQRSWHQVPAVLLAGAPLAGGFGAAAPGRWSRPGRWAGPGGAPRTGTVAAPPGAPAGRTILMWVDAAGRPAGQPLHRSQVRAEAATAAVLAPLLLGVLASCAGLLAHGGLGLRRMAAWDTDWRATEPRWTRRQ